MNTLSETGFPAVRGDETSEVALFFQAPYTRSMKAAALR